MSGGKLGPEDAAEEGDAGRWKHRPDLDKMMRPHEVQVPPGTFKDGESFEVTTDMTLIEGPDQTWNPKDVGELMGSALVYDADGSSRLVQVLCPACKVLVVELPEGEVVGQWTCPNCEEEFDAG